MKKIVVILGLFLLIASNTLPSYCAEQSLPTIKNTDVTVFGKDNKFGIKDKKGIILVPAEYKKLIRVGETSWIIQKGSRYGLIDSRGNYLVKPRYRHVERILIKYVKLGNDNDYGLYDETGKAIIPPEYSSIEPLFGDMFLTCQKYKYGIYDINGTKLLPNKYDDIYMPDPHSLRIRYLGEWFEIEKAQENEIAMPEDSEKVTINDKEFKITYLVTNTGAISGYSALTVTDYILKLLSSISPAYEQTIDELMFSQGAEGISIFVKLGWIPKFPFTYIKKYYQTYRNPNNGPLSDIRSDLKRQIK